MLAPEPPGQRQSTKNCGQPSSSLPSVGGCRRRPWTEVTPDLSPPPRITPGMAYDSQSDWIILFGGHTKLRGDVMGDTWVYDTNTNAWAEMQSSVSPPARSGRAVWSDSTVDATFVFGGSADESGWPSLRGWPSAERNCGATTSRPAAGSCTE